MWIRRFNSLMSIMSSILVIIALCGCSSDQEPTPAVSTSHFEVGQMFRDCETCPQMVVVPAGTFRMGSSRAEQDWSVEHERPREYTDRENPIHEVTITQPFAAGVHESHAYPDCARCMVALERVVPRLLCARETRPTCALRS